MVGGFRLDMGDSAARPNRKMINRRSFAAGE
jgi:hypothetical protein